MGNARPNFVVPGPFQILPPVVYWLLEYQIKRICWRFLSGFDGLLISHFGSAGFAQETARIWDLLAEWLDKISTLDISR
jgi:hypothetical protein